MPSPLIRSWDTIESTYEDWTVGYYDGSTYNSSLYTGTSCISIQGSAGRGRNTRDFHKRVKKGELIPHTFFEKFEVKGSASVDYYATSPGDAYHDSSGSPWLRDGWQLTEEILCEKAPEHSYLAQQAASRIMTSGFDALTFLAEFSDIPKMFCSAAVKLVKLDWPKNALEMSNDWLTYRYGWRPLLNDIKDINDAIRSLNDKKQKSRLKESVRRKLESDSSYSDSVYETKSYRQNHETFSDSWTVYGAGSVVADIDIPEFQFNPVLTAWELVPFSFVLDWFIGVGQSLAAMVFLTLNSSYAASSGYRIEYIREYTTYSVFTDDEYGGHYDTQGSCEATLEMRIPCQISLKPQLKLNIDVLKILDLLGMIIQKRG